MRRRVSAVARARVFVLASEGLPQRTIAERLGLSTSIVNAILRGKR